MIENDFRHAMRYYCFAEASILRETINYEINNVHNPHVDKVYHKRYYYTR